MKFKVVVDTNLFIAAYYNENSASARILNMIAQRELVFIWSEPIKKEIDKILSNIKARPRYLKKISSKILLEEHRVEPGARVKEVYEDPDDNKFLEAGLAGGADYIVTSDKHLLHLGEFQKMPILTPTNFAKILKP